MSEPSLGMLSAAVTDLAARVETIDSQIGEAGGASSIELERRLHAVEGLLAEIRKTVSKVAQNKAAADTQAQMRQPWHKLTAEQAEKRWIELNGWVTWLLMRDNIGTKEIPDCWHMHGGLIDELEALRWAWIESNAPTSKMTAPIWWREALQRARTRWPLFNPNGCTSAHTATRPRAPGEDRDWRSFFDQELASRPTDRSTRGS